MLNFVFKMIQSFLGEVSLSLISSGIFYFMVVYFPRKSQNKVAVEFLVQQYRRVKMRIINILINYFYKTGEYEEIEENLYDYNFVRKLITNEDLNKLRNYVDSEQFFQLNQDILSELDIIKNALLQTLSYDFIRSNKIAYVRFNYLIQWIDQFHQAFDTTYRDNDSLEYSKAFCIFINEFIRGFSLISGEIQTDDFVKIIDNAYKASLFLDKMCPKWFVGYEKSYRQ